MKYSEHKGIFLHFLLFFLSIFLVAGGILAFFYIKYNDRITPGVRVGSLHLGGLTQDDAALVIENSLGRFFDEGFVFVYKDKRVLLSPVQSDSNNIDLSRELFYFDKDVIVENAYSYGKNENFFNNIFTRLHSIFFGKNFSFSYILDEEAIQFFLEREFGEFVTPARNAALVYEEETKKFQVEQERIGKIFHFNKIIDELHEALRVSAYKVFYLELESEYPRYNKVAFLPFLEEANVLLEELPVVFVFEDKKWTIGPDEFGPWIILDLAEQKFSLAINGEAFQKFFAPIKAEIDIRPQNAKFQIQDGKVTTFLPSISGRELDLPRTKSMLEEQLVKKQFTDITLETREVFPEVTNENANDLGIKEIIGIGHSNFKGSPKNRRHNIAIGAKAVNGTLIAPDEEFSLLRVLGEIDKESGYLPELVIKGNRTIPEYGGGLCQIGTTTLRATMASGLPVLERQNHSYSVSYYLENGLPGTDATIYPPHPDMKFQNDTGHYILIQTRIEGDDLYFEFWGMKDGRVSTRTKPNVWDVVSPPETKIIESEDLSPGVKKCTEKSHKGMKAKFDYTVKYSSGEEKIQTFYSTYRPWQAVCLVGVEKLSEEENVSKENVEQKPQEKQN